MSLLLHRTSILTSKPRMEVTFRGKRCKTWPLMAWQSCLQLTLLPRGGPQKSSVNRAVAVLRGQETQRNRALPTRLTFHCRMISIAVQQNTIGSIIESIGYGQGIARTVR